MLFGVTFSAAAQRVVTGKITNQNGEAIPSVVIGVVGSSEGSISDIDGNYRITVPDDYAIVVFKFPGSKTQEMVIGTRTVLDVEMNVSAPSETKTEIIQAGIGTTSKAQNTGNISQVSGDEIRDNPVSNLEASMQGRTAGVIGKSTGVQVRGSASLTASNEPLYVVDGVPLASGNQSNQCFPLGS